VILFAFLEVDKETLKKGFVNEKEKMKRNGKESVFSFQAVS